MPGRSVSSACLLRQVSSALSRNRRNESRPDVDEARFLALNSWHGNCMDSSDVNTEIQNCSRVAG